MINVSQIERFATHDGPGIRTTVFLKGCPLHCPWCANPETWSVEPVLMHREEICVKCGCCEKVCPNQAVRVENGRFLLNRGLCDTCGICVKECLNQALTVNGMRMKEEDVIREVLKDWDYYEESGGGVTFSGGEPLYQREILNLLEKARKAGLHIAVETTGAVAPDHFQKAEPLIDLFLFDIKHVREKPLQETVGAPWDLIRQNLLWLSGKRGKDVILRVPVIPGFNEDDLEEILAFARSLPVQKIQLLPFHNLGKGKWHQLDRPYRYEKNTGMSKDRLRCYEDAMVSVGGS